MARCEDYPCCGHNDGGCGVTYRPRNGGGRRGGYRTPPREGTTRANKYAGECAHCAETVAAGAGIIRATRGQWVVQHRPLVTPTGPWDRYSGGCPGEAAAAQERLTGVHAV